MMTSFQWKSTCQQLAAFFTFYLLPSNLYLQARCSKVYVVTYHSVYSGFEKVDNLVVVSTLQASRHMQGVCCWFPVCWGCSIKYFGTHQCRVKPTDWEIHPEIRNMYKPLLQCQSSSGSVGKSIWLEFRKPSRFESWLNLNVFSCQEFMCKHTKWNGMLVNKTIQHIPCRIMATRDSRGLGTRLQVGGDLIKRISIPKIGINCSLLITWQRSWLSSGEVYIAILVHVSYVTDP